MVARAKGSGYLTKIQRCVISSTCAFSCIFAAHSLRVARRRPDTQAVTISASRVSHVHSLIQHTLLMARTSCDCSSCLLRQVPTTRHSSQTLQQLRCCTSNFIDIHQSNSSCQQAVAWNNYTLRSSANGLPTGQGVCTQAQAGLPLLTHD